MSYTKALDVSVYQGVINWSAVKAAGYQIALIKMGGGDNGLYPDAKANANYYAAKGAGLALGGYWFAGGQNAQNEADCFISYMSPIEENDVFILDWEIPHGDPVGWVNAFVNRVHDRTGVWPLVYMNGSTATSHDWSPVFANCGLWVANWNNNPDGPAVVPMTYVMHQYTSDGSVPGIAGRVDLDAWYGSVDQFKKYGFHAPTPVPPVVTPPPVTPPVEPPVVTPPVEPPVVTPPVEPPVTPPVVDPTPPPAPIKPPVQTWVEKLIKWLKEFFGIKG